MKRILVVGKGSYIGQSFKRWLEQYPEKYEVGIVNVKNGAWKKIDFSQYEVVVCFVGIAHINNIKEDMKSLFYSVNRDLSFQIAKWAKEHGVKHHILLSSMNVYGDYCDCIIDRNKENPTSFYGDSKLQGDAAIRKLECENFVVSYVRPPFVYGKGCTGNYKIISNIAQRSPIFPTYENKKSMIYIDNLCEFIRMTIDRRQGGILTPQNKELISVVDLVREIAKCHNKKIFFTGGLNWLIKPMCKITKMFKKAFANDYYAPKISDYWDNKYCLVCFEESIKRTEFD